MYRSISESPVKVGGYHYTVIDVSVKVTRVGAGKPLGTVMGVTFAETL